MSTVHEPLIDAIYAALAAAADPAKAGPMQAYMKSTLPFWGVQKKPRTRALRPVFAAHPIGEAAAWRATVLALFRGATHYEVRYAALELLGHRRYKAWVDLDALPVLEALIVEGAWWDIVDEVASRRVGELLRRHRAEVTPTLRAWSTDADRWRRRTSVIAQLKHKSETDLALLEDAIVANLDDKDFFLRKGIGWALREYSKTDPDWVRAFCATHEGRLSPLSRREALKHL